MDCVQGVLAILTTILINKGGATHDEIKNAIQTLKGTMGTADDGHGTAVSEQSKVDFSLLDLCEDDDDAPPQELYSN